MALLPYGSRLRPELAEGAIHSVKEYVRGMAHANGIESFWAKANMKCGHQGVYHHWSEKHLGRYVTEFKGRHNARPMDTAEQMDAMAQVTVGKRFRYVDLTADAA